ncbi:hypothetical protein Ddye_004344 [Dipteronia dyeriana]|uniref:RING-type domain-containing protein n=1 Tax=Dipteronia dyeriana TaxID=168575 RepID=A0AAE0CW80_9ROSI|nr:hypothetical protein Ddye_004344 [Dipteronia dyeriana]
MIGLVYFESPLCVASLVFYLCILMPLRQVKNVVVRIILGGEDIEEAEETLDQLVVPYLEEEEGMCSICLVELDKEEAVSRLSRCGHIFHMDCIQRWLHSNHFTCPLCRSFLLTNLHSSHAKIKM